MNSHRMKTWPLCAVSLIASLTGSAASAQTVYRCGNAYTQVPCTQGVAVNATTGVSAGDRQEAERIVARERRLAREMEDDRRRSEAGLPTKAGSFTAARPATAAASALHRAAAKKRKPSRSDLTIAGIDDDDAVFTAAVPGALRKR